MSFYAHPTAWATLLLALVSILYTVRSRKARSKLPLPPGPKKTPLLGNLLDIPAAHPWETYMAWSKEYNSDILHLDLAGKSLIVLSSVEATEDLLEKRSAIYSDRARLPMLTELMGWDFNIGVCRTRAHRRLFKQGFTARVSLKYRPKQLKATHELLRRFLHAPDDFMDHLRQWAAEIIMSVAYGIDVLPVADPYVALAHEAVRTLSDAGVPGKYLVDSFPFLKHVPACLPGAAFKRRAREWAKLARAIADVPLAETKRQMEAGTARPSFTADCLQSLKDAPDSVFYTEHTVRATAATMYLGGADTSVSALATFVLAMLASPAAQHRAQAEIDSVTGGQRLPDFADERAMPYVAAVVMEVLRWRNVGPIAIPHYLAVEDEYRGYRIPAGSVVIGNTWAILHDEATYPDPYAFKPERFLVGGQLNPAVPSPDVAFGYGRRLCPGRHSASAALWIAIASILATVDITKARDEREEEIEPSYEFDSGFINAPLPFKCTIRPRSQGAEALIRATGQDESRG
ncbi:cytochrome P450 [Mycena latifolia]|nr:cytochrome P450 [Mycena latifolia]